VSGKLDTIMVGLACGEPSIVAWHELNHAARAFMAIPDYAPIAASGCLLNTESGVAGLAGCLLVSGDPEAREAVGLTTSSRVLAFNTEGATDPLLYEQMVGHPPTIADQHI
jgi:diaminopropionate ammonia-lyase